MITAQHSESVNSASMALADLKAFTDGEDDGGSSFLANIHKEQKRLNNLEPSTNPGNGKVTNGKGYVCWLKTTGSVIAVQLSYHADRTHLSWQETQVNSVCMRRMTSQASKPGRFASGGCNYATAQVTCCSVS